MDWNALIGWSKNHFSNLPWRQNRSFYTTLVSEIMLVQTQVKTVIPKFNEFLKVFPDLPSLAGAPEETVLQMWMGLGYYRRARQLHALVKAFNQHIPQTFEELLTYQGVGDYLARSIRVMGEDHWHLCLDANIKRVMVRLLGITDKNTMQNLENDFAFFDSTIRLRARDLNEALMDLGRTLCKPTSPRCHECPLQKSCNAFRTQRFDLPAPKAAKTTQKVNIARIIAIHPTMADHYLVKLKEPSQWLAGQFELPTYALDKDLVPPHQYPSIKECPLPLASAPITTLKTHITHYQFINHLFLAPPGTNLLHCTYTSIRDPKMSHTAVKLIKKATGQGITKTKK